MTDTPEAIQNLYRDMLMRRSGSERLRMGCVMFDAARVLARASLRTVSQDDNTLRAQLFLRTYGGDFPAETTERILNWLSHPRTISQGRQAV